MLMPAGQSTETNDLGAFRAYGLAAGDYYLQAAPQISGPRNGTPTTAMPAPTYFPDVTFIRDAQPISVLAGQNVVDIVVRVQTRPVFQLSGVVVDEAGVPVSDAMVNLMPDSAGMMPSPTFTPPIRTGPKGEFAFVNLFPGNYRISAALPVTSSPARPGVPPGVGGGVTGGVTGGVAGAIGVVGGGITSWSSTQSANGVTTQYRSDGSMPKAVALGDANVADVRVVVRR
jgi:hypothetical protein